MDNKKLLEAVEKAIDSTTLSSSGKLNDEQASKFLDYVFDETTLKGQVRQVKFRGEKAKIDKMGVGARVAYAAEEATDPGFRVGVSTSQVTLEGFEFIVPIEITQTFKEINLEGESVTNTIMRLIAKALANNLEQKAILGNATNGGPSITQNAYTGSGSATNRVRDKFFGQQDGWLKLIHDGGHVKDMEDSRDIEDAAYEAQQLMPTGYLNNSMAAMRYIMSTRMHTRWLRNLQGRQTGLGDQAVTGQIQPDLMGITPLKVPLFPDRPQYVKRVQLNSGEPVALGFQPLKETEVFVLPEDLDTTATTPFVLGDDYTFDEETGEIMLVDGGDIDDGDFVNVTFNVGPQMLLTWPANLIWGMNREITMEMDRDIVKRVDIIVITGKMAINVEQLDGTVLLENMSQLRQA